DLFPWIQCFSSSIALVWEFSVHSFCLFLWFSGRVLCISGQPQSRYMGVEDSDFLMLLPPFPK
uniref:Uncharacterized protein n=1 Tax=Mus spicilegus TaxID=10103 RepID=A0A8C6MTV3_MUSSI